MSLRFKAISDPDGSGSNSKEQKTDLGNGSEVVYVPRLLTSDESWKFFDYLNKEIPWTRPTIRVFGRSHVQPRDTCYVASKGLPELIYSGYQPHAYSWDDFPPLKDILDAVHKALPGSTFNSLLLNRYKGGNDNVGWHADDEKLYGPTPEIASVSFGCEREFLMKQKPSKSSQERSDDEPVSKRLKKSSNPDHHSFTLKHGSLLVMRGYTQRDWLHSVPKRAKAEATRINLTFRSWSVAFNLSGCLSIIQLVLKLQEKRSREGRCGVDKTEKRGERRESGERDGERRRKKEKEGGDLFQPLLF